MHFHCIFRTIIFLSVVVSALIDFSDFTEPYDEPGSLLFDPNTPFDPNTRFDPNTPLFDEEFTVSLDPLTFLDQSTNPEIPSSDILWDDSFKLASCSTLSRVRRADDSASCDYVSSEDDRKIIESLTQGRFSVTCTLLTMGALPWGLIPSDAAQDVVTNSNVFSVATLGYGPRPFFASTLYRATLVLGAAGTAPPFPEAWCCQTYEQTTLLYVTGFNCVDLGVLFSPPGTPLKP